MVLGVALIALLGWLDNRREAEAALEDFSREQATLATSVAGQLRERLRSVQRDLEVGAPRSERVEVLARNVAAGAPFPAARDGAIVVRARTSAGLVDAAIAVGPLLGDVAQLSHPGESRILVRAPGSSDLFDATGEQLSRLPHLDAPAAGATAFRFDRAQAPAFGLPARTAVAGLVSVDGGALGRWGVVVVNSASRERDRQQRASLRLLLGVTLAGGLVFVFGAIALGKQRRELDLARQLELEALARQRDERLVRADRVAVMGTLASGVAHEISTPLAVIAGRTEQLLAREAREGGDERARRHLEVIQEQTARIGGVVRGFMDLARGGAPVLAAVAPESIVRAAVRLTEHRLVAREVELKTDMAADLPEIHCDHRLLEHALVNLLLNAAAACERGGHVDVTVRADDGQLGFVVDDDGAGITPEAAARATEPFFTTKPVGEGTGLGLAITHEIIKAHRGTLTLAPRRGGGTRAVISIPTHAIA